ncbi:MAG: ABC transporter substrate-binding protein [Planctomycetes bacterium]|nr:ABC transporter substrate-binding protein [Planctomycetota bacterium]
MQQNFVLQALKTLVILAFTLALGLTFFQNQSLEQKFVRTHDKVDELVGQVAEQGRKIGQSVEEMRAARAAAEATQQRLEAIVELAAKGQLEAKGGGTGEGPAGEPTGKPSVIAGKTVYPRNPGWTVLCDTTTNADPKRDLAPADQIDWDATLDDYTPGEPKGWNPYSTDRTSTVVALSVYTLDSLAERKTSNYTEWNAQLAERIEESPDHMRYMIYLRKGIRWHDPEPEMLAAHPWLKEPRFVTAKDVKFTVDLLRDPAAASPLAYLYDDLESIEIRDEHTIEMTWKRPNFYARAITLELQPIPEHIWASDPDGVRYPDADIGPQFGKHWFGKSICGSGPLRFVEYKRGEYVRCERNENYYGPRFPSKTYYYHIIRDDETRLARFWNRELVAIIPGYEQYRKYVLEGDPKLKLYKFETYGKPAPASWAHTYRHWRRPTYSGFGWNMRKPQLKDKRVRRALTMALNRGAIIENIFYGLGEQLAIGESVFSPYNHPGLKPLPFDLEAAKRLLDEAGWKDGDGDGIREKEIDGKKLDFGSRCSRRLPSGRSRSTTGPSTCSSSSGRRAWTATRGRSGSRSGRTILRPATTRGSGASGRTRSSTCSSPRSTSTRGRSSSASGTRSSTTRSRTPGSTPLSPRCSSTPTGTSPSRGSPSPSLTVV